MCGICGQLRFDKQVVKSQDLETMMQKIARRGPDDSGIWLDKNVGLGHRRLSIIDLSNHAHQPMVDDTLSLSLVFNGTIYNYKSLRQDLIKQGYRFFSTSDTEVILKSYHLWGEDCVLHLDGMFAFCIWDGKKLFVARDRMGIKPLYFNLTNQTFSFASNTQALSVIGADTSINSIALQQQLSLHGVVPAPNTILNGVNKVKPATTLSIDSKGKIVEKQYWQPKAQRTGLTDEEYLEKTHELLIKAVDKRMLAADVPIGVLLSGGLDSSLLVGLLHEAGHSDIRTFSIGFEDIDDESGSEFEYSDQIVKKFNTKHEKYIVSNSQVLPRLEEAVANMAEPMVGQDAVAFYLLSEQVSKHIKVVLSGQGADEAFAGYFWYARMQSESGSEFERFAKHYVDRPYEEYLQTVNASYHTGNHTQDWLNKEFSKDNTGEFMDKIFRTDITRLIVDDPVKRVDNMTMAWGLEARVPFMDTHLIEHALSIPPSLKMRDGGKYPLKRISRGLLPDSVIDRKKGYFPMPALKYVRGEFLEFMTDILNSTQCINRGLYNQNFVQKVISQPEQYMTALNGSRLWHLALLEYWLQVNIDG
ncbi:Asparagine synthetase [glutamine-hydrolyzing] (EC 6.3.5.4) [uncultured Gammaproteobacteria bacterium]|jgi:asparagine synthase (glutamine-hydrolysing)|uniref:N-acetylglutaminylglutamine amidotransferase n=1 Tax=thiotrophic endosymbiont of Bathymodiolus puteoserpentis (Logatchev) TaxID=343240 RepID=UPI0010B31C5C|nr:N-acetylglutaminylglutamine amidotransferase [thiotrophic endosymbiont of Bathymodiolus puteoserpentis (Logatchev)]CAC9501718.1 Asparagine synthetase [glutamine-hydrolyzing] (EC 6.3.5.4) [uncultured Gammaproteobacteria bacterium]CAC9507869.1 Asparagine synthetase [glutamine-hydrolyzing] (EC 6.3.5.4) [uncultured Gammaproteobacteria bacterium]CAC9590668.1 Asparagine synthetase [glutamine-hydrolyzing] (EC 6.3.5.4) [uncultured Gammaproteobacteria bacterium]CAC9986740.1 Asparagine synthetase [glu